MTKIKATPQPSPSCEACLPDRAHIVQGGHGYAFEVKKGTCFRIIDIYGRQIVDMMAWVKPYDVRGEHLSMAYSRYKLGGNIPPAIGECLFTNKQEPIFKLKEDQCHTHDMTFMACNPAFYAERGAKNHRSCATNIAEAMKPFGMESYLEATSVDPFNVFQNTPDYSLKDLGASRPGDYVEFEVLKDAIVGVSSCPFDLHGFGKGKATDIVIVNPALKVDNIVSLRDNNVLPTAIAPAVNPAALSPEELTEAIKRLFRAAEHGDLEVVLSSIEKIGDVNIKDRAHNKTAVHWAAEKGYTDMLTVLLIQGADHKSADKYGETPLHYAAEKGRIECVSILLKVGSDPHAVDRRRRTALRCARDNGHDDPVRMLLPFWRGQSKDLEEKDSQGRTVVHWAAMLGAEGHMADFKKLGMTKNATGPDNRGKTPAQYAEERMKTSLAGWSKPN